jgi:hypothetical protein
MRSLARASIADGEVEGGGPQRLQAVRGVDRSVDALDAGLAGLPQRSATLSWITYLTPPSGTSLLRAHPVVVLWCGHAGGVDLTTVPASLPRRRGEC